MSFTPSIVIHGGAGSITRTNLPPTSTSYAAYVSSLHSILSSTHALLQNPITTALTAAVSAVIALENNPLFNAGRGAVFNRAGHNELEASVMVTRGSAKRGVGVQLLRRVKNPIVLARELLERVGEVKHNCLSGAEAERLAEAWGVELVGEDWFWTERRWKQHLRGLEKEERGAGEKVWELDELEEYLPQGTVGCVVRDRWGTVCVATSTGGLTNKLPGRIGDTPTLGAGFWAEEWAVREPRGWWEEYVVGCAQPVQLQRERKRAVAMSGTGNGDYFLRMAAAHAVTARCRFGGMTLREAMKETLREMREAAEDVGEWGKGDGEGGFIGIDGDGNIEMELNCGGMFRGLIDEDGRTKVAVFADEELRFEDD